MWRIAVASMVLLGSSLLSFAQAPASLPASNPTTSPSLASPEGFLKLVKLEENPPLPDGWDAMTSAQRDELLRTRSSTGVKDYRGQKVTWLLSVNGVSQVHSPADLIKVEAVSSPACLVTCYLPTQSREALLKLKKGSTVRMSGAVAGYATAKADPQLRPSRYGVAEFGVLLENAEVTPVLTTKFYGIDVEAQDVVFAIDRSGSMMDAFDSVRNELLKCIASLQEGIQFALLMWNAGSPLEMKAQKLIEPSDENRAAAKEFLSTIQPEHQSNPTAALKRAFEVLAQGEKDRTKAIVLLTDGPFPDNDQAQRVIASLNSKKAVRVYVILMGKQPKDVADFTEALAKENGGRSKIVPASE